MMKPLRKKHLITWSFLALLLPSGIIIAYTSIPKPALQQLLQPLSVTPLPIIIKKAGKPGYGVAVRSNSSGTQLQLEWINKKVLQYPTATIYAGDAIPPAGNAKLVGRIEARGSWYFPLDSTFRTTATEHFILYDFIHQQVIDTINCIP